MTERARRILDAVIALDPLSDLPRTGWLLRGVRPCESIADHTLGVALFTMLVVDALRAEGAHVDGEKALRMALVHDAPEARLGDVPKPVKTAEFDRALGVVETMLAERLLPPEPLAAWREAELGESLEARIVKAADRLHMMTKAYLYEQRGQHVQDFWRHPSNFDARGVDVAGEIFDELCARAGHPLPTS